MRKRILVLSPHTDDGEIGAGGSLARFLREGAEVHYVAFSYCEESTPVGYEKGCLKDECIAAIGSLGISDFNILNYPVRNFDKFRQDILEFMIDLRRDYNPDLVFTPASTDCHQDHRVIYEESVRAFKSITMFGYIFPWNSLSTKPNVAIDLQESDALAKLTALSFYRSQANRPYFSEESIMAQLIASGTFVGAPRAETFECIRLREK